MRNSTLIDNCYAVSDLEAYQVNDELGLYHEQFMLK